MAWDARYKEDVDAIWQAYEAEIRALSRHDFQKATFTLWKRKRDTPFKYNYLAEVTRNLKYKAFIGGAYE